MWSGLELFAGLFGFWFVVLCAFSRPVKNLIGRRDRWSCVNCGKKFRDGWMIDVAHISHDKSDKEYNTVNNGKCLCLKCHELDHRDQNDPSLTPAQHSWAAQQIAKRDKRTRWWRQKHGG